MNLLALANTVITSVNPNIPVVWIQSSGYTTDAAGKRVSSTTSTTIQAQVQGISASDLRHVDNLGIEGVKRSVHMFGNVQGVVRADQKGGDILQFPEIPGGAVRNWRVVNVMETYPDWSRVLVVLQTT
jgi:hypothetical protein